MRYFEGKKASNAQNGNGNNGCGGFNNDRFNNGDRVRPQNSTLFFLCTQCFLCISAFDLDRPDADNGNIRFDRPERFQNSYVCL